MEGEHLEEREGEFQQSLGLSYETSPRLLFGAEFVHEIAFPEWSGAQPGKFFAGPNISIRHRTGWVTLTTLCQITRAGDEPDFQVRTIFGFSF